jgi:DNA repair protein RadC
MYHISIYKCMLVKDGSQAFENPPISTPANAAEIVATYLKGADREHFIVLLLNTKNRINGIHTLSIGTLNSALVHPRECFKPAILANCSAILLAHNHPSGDPSPSSEDTALTRRLVEAGKVLGIEVLDHVVIGDEGRHYSFRERGLM